MSWRELMRKAEGHDIKDCMESIPNRIMSIVKPYVKPIVRGEEVKSIEFGVKVNNTLIDGITFI